MVDYFAIALTHGLIALAVWRLMNRDDLDSDTAEAAKPARPWLKDRDG
jgi:hypothetical protein